MILGWVTKNSEWVFSGVGVFIVGLIAQAFLRRAPSNQKLETSNIQNNINIGNVNSTASGGAISQAHPANGLGSPSNSDPKMSTRILFVDDDTRFKVVKILQKSGWAYVKIVKDIASLDAPELVEATILFVDIQGVGRKLQFSDEGLGLAAAIKKKYPEKKVVIYSSQTSGERFHEGLRLADDTLAKNADPYEFLRLVEKYASD